MEINRVRSKGNRKVLTLEGAGKLWGDVWEQDLRNKKQLSLPRAMEIRFPAAETQVPGLGVRQKDQRGYKSTRRTEWIILEKTDGGQII